MVVQQHDILRAILPTAGTRGSKIMKGCQVLGLQQVGGKQRTAGGLWRWSTLLSRIVTFGLAFGVLCTASQAIAQILVTNSEELNRALRTVRGGERIALSPGEYGQLQLRGRPGALWGSDRSVVIQSADSRNPAILRGFSVAFVRNLTLTNLVFSYRFSATDTVGIRPFTVRESIGVAIDGVQFIGDTASGTGTPADGFGTGVALDVSLSRNIRVERCTFDTWHRAAVFHSTKSLIVQDNIVRNLRSDGFNFAQVNNVMIKRNAFSNFRTSLTTGDHPDMIQFWTNKTTEPSTDVEIEDNLLDIGEGNWTQSIFMRNEEVDRGRAGQEMFYRNISIRGNFIRNSHLHGITVGETNGLIIANNTLIQAAEAPRPMHVTVPSININKMSRNVRIENNIAPRFSQLAPDWVSINNIQIQRTFPRAKDFYSKYFVDALVTGAAPLDSFQLLPELSNGTISAGSAIGQFNERPPSARLLISSAAVSAGRGSDQRLEVIGAYGPEGKLDLTNATAEWSLGEGILRHGLSITHRFDTLGVHRPTVVVTMKNGEKIAGARSILID
jgi:hypothetical protein